MAAAACSHKMKTQSLFIFVVLSAAILFRILSEETDFCSLFNSIWKELACHALQQAPFFVKVGFFSIKQKPGNYRHRTPQLRRSESLLRTRQRGKHCSPRMIHLTAYLPLRPLEVLWGKKFSLCKSDITFFSFYWILLYKSNSKWERKLSYSSQCTSSLEK